MNRVGRVSEAQSAAPATLPQELTAQLLADVDIIARRMTRRLADEIPLPVDFHRIGYLRSIMRACRDGLGTLVHLLHDGNGPRSADLDRLGLMGARQAEMGVPLEVLLHAYRLAAKIVWQEVIGETTRIHELPPAAVVVVTSQVLEYLDEISGAVGRAYLETRERLMRQRDRDRDRILQRLLAGDSSEELRRLAAAADLHLVPPYRVVACSLVGEGDGERVLDRTWRKSGGLVVADEPGAWIALVPPEVDIPRLGAAACAMLSRPGPDAPRLVYGIGPVAASLMEVAPAAGRARQALGVGRRLHPELAFHDEAEMAPFATLAGDPEGLRRYVNRVLGPLLTQDSARNRDLLTTLETLLSSRNLTDAAASLGLHRHTVVYRIRRLTDSGIDVDDPGQRHRLWLALRARRLLESL